MRTARLMGLSQDGQTLVVVTDTGEELALAADDRLRAALRGDRPRLGQLEIEMDSALRPRDIQSRIRSGESLDDVARAAGIPLDRVERFAAPVLAEREHVARLAVAASVRRRGETSGHRNLRVALTERLASRGVDVDDVEWDSHRMEDGRWAVAGTYRSGDSDREALFFYDLRGRFSVAGNDEARWVLGEHVAAAAATRRRSETGEPDTEPTVDLSDELALVRAVQEPVRAAADLLRGIDSSAVESRVHDVDLTDDTAVSELFDDADLPGAVEREVIPTPDGPAQTEPEELELPLDADPHVADALESSPEAVGSQIAGDESGDQGERKPTSDDAASEQHDLGSGDDAPAATPEHPGFEISHQTWEEEVEQSRDEEADAAHSDLDTLYGMLGDDERIGGSPRASRGLSDASAVPETDNVGWEPAIMVDYPVEPSASDDEAEPVTQIVVANDPSEEVASADQPEASTPDGGENEPAQLEGHPLEAQTSENHASAPDVPALDVPTPDVAALDVPTPDVAALDVPAPDVAALDVPAPDVQTGRPAAESADDGATQPALVPEPVNASEGEPGDAASSAPPKKPTKRKRASVPSWDEIMFGGPKRS